MRVWLLTALIAVAACSSGSRAIAEGTYGGEYADGTEVVVVIVGATVEVNGFRTEVDDSQTKLTFTVQPAVASRARTADLPKWACDATESGDAMRCEVTVRTRKETVELMRE